MEGLQCLVCFSDHAVISKVSRVAANYLIRRPYLTIAEMQWLELAFWLTRKECSAVASTTVLGLKEEDWWIQW